MSEDKSQYNDTSLKRLYWLLVLNCRVLVKKSKNEFQSKLSKVQTDHMWCSSFTSRELANGVGGQHCKAGLGLEAWLRPAWVGTGHADSYHPWQPAGTGQLSPGGEGNLKSHHTHTHTDMHTCTHTHRQKHAYTHTHTHTHTHYTLSGNTSRICMFVLRCHQGLFSVFLWFVMVGWFLPFKHHNLCWFGLVALSFWTILLFLMSRATSVVPFSRCKLERTEELLVTNEPLLTFSVYIYLFYLFMISPPSSVPMARWGWGGVFPSTTNSLKLKPNCVAQRK